MQILEVRIDGFGIFANKHLTGLACGINVIYGPNEVGKSTFLEFVRRILFGFPRSSSSTNPYPALQGGAYGGKLVCKLDNGKNLAIDRKQGSHGGHVTILLDSQELTGQEELNIILGHITKTFYENVYAFGLDELQAMKSLQEEDVKDLIYGAGLGIGNISLSDIKNELRSHSESLYKPRGSVHKLHKLYDEIKKFEGEIREIQKSLSTYDNLLMQLNALSDEISRLEREINDIEATQRLIEKEKSLYPTYMDMKNAQYELSKTEKSPDFPEDVLKNLEKKNTEITNLDIHVNQIEAKIRTLVSKKDGLVYNKNILDKEPTVISLLSSREAYKLALGDKNNVGMKRNALTERIEKDIIKLGQGRSEAFIRDFKLSHLEQDKIRSYENDFDETRRKLNSAKDKLTFHKEQKAAQAPQAFTGPDFYKYATFAVTGLGLVGTILALLSSQWWFAAFSSTFLGIGIWVSLKIGKWDGIKSIDTLENTLNERIGQAEADQDRLGSEWRTFLRGINLDENLTPQGVLDVIKTIQDIQSHMSQLDDFETRISQMQGTIDKVESLHNQVTPCLDRSKLSDDVGTNIEIITQYLNNAKNTKKDMENIEEQIKGLITERKILRNNKEAKENERQDFISSLHATDEDDLKRKYRVFTRRNELSVKIDESKLTIQKSVGANDHYNKFIESISSKTPQEIETKFDQVNAQIDCLGKERNTKNQNVGELKREIAQLSSSQDLLIKQNEMEFKKQQMIDYSKEWAKSQIALVMLDKAISKYENTRQPGVINEASSIFSSITNRYPTIVKLVDSDEIRIKEEFGNNKSLLETSRGTKEQLYFSMRLGLIKEYEKRSESMPIIMDDILVNFDDERGPSAIQILADFAKDRQVIVLTCHKNALDIYKEHGANEIAFS